MNVIAVDVGTTSVRLSIVSFGGDQYKSARVLASREQNTTLHHNGLEFEQSSREIWQKICCCTKECLSEAKINAESIKSIAFSATCSLVIQDGEGSSHSDENEIIMWMDHRAIDEAQVITNECSSVLEQFGGVCSPEFSLPKLVWLKNHKPARFCNASGFFELPDWLVYRCIGGDPIRCPRSLCGVTCKMGYDVENRSHCDILKGLGASFQDKIGKTIFGPGTPAGWLSQEAALELGLYSPLDQGNSAPPKVSVGTSLIDAHSGMLAMLSVPLETHGINCTIESMFCSLAGTSSCHMLLSKKKKFTRGIWGPYKDAILDGYYLLEAGQSLTGKLVEISIEYHEEGKARLEAGESMHQIIQSLNNQSKTTKLEKGLHILPTFHGSRSPLANPRLKGGVYGLTAEGQRSLLEYYVATLESIAYETKLIIETLGAQLDTVLVSGGLMKNSLFMQTLANVLQCRVVTMSLGNVDLMVMGSALVARHAALSLVEGSGIKGPLNSSSIEDMCYEQLNVGSFEPDFSQSKYFETGYSCYKEFVEFSKRVDKILHDD